MGYCAGGRKKTLSNYLCQHLKCVPFNIFLKGYADALTVCWVKIIYFVKNNFFLLNCKYKYCNFDKTQEL